MVVRHGGRARKSHPPRVHQLVGPSLQCMLERHWWGTGSIKADSDGVSGVRHHRRLQPGRTNWYGCVFDRCALRDGSTTSVCRDSADRFQIYRRSTSPSGQHRLRSVNVSAVVHSDDEDDASSVVDSIEHAVGPATGTEQSRQVVS